MVPGLYAASFQFQLRARHLPGTHDKVADALSLNNLALFHSLHPQADRVPMSIPLDLISLLVQEKPDWTLHCWTTLWTKGHASSTQRVYSTGINKYLRFCNYISATPTPASEHLSCRLIASLALDNITANLIKVCHLAAAHSEKALSTTHREHGASCTDSKRHQDITSFGEQTTNLPEISNNSRNAA